jgi:hypothetical protein
MGEAIERSGVPKWVWSGIFTILIGLMSFGVAAIAGNQKMKDDIFNNSKAIELKANEEKVEAMEKEQDRVYETLIRIEGKLDEHIKHD